jgi:hypothetical protein
VKKPGRGVYFHPVNEWRTSQAGFDLALSAGAFGGRF